MVIKYTDRNFPVGEEYKDNLYFILKREEDDQERKVMLEGLEKEGITYEIEDEAFPAKIRLHHQYFSAE